MSLKSLEIEKKSIIKEIEYYQNILEGKILPTYKEKITKVETDVEITKSQISALQQKLLLNSASYSVEELLLGKKELNSLCDKLIELERNLKEKQEEYNSKKKELNLSNFDDIKNLILKEQENLKKINQKISDEREKERLKNINDNTTQDKDLEKIWIDENLGIYVKIDKKELIRLVVKDFFNDKIPDENIDYYTNSKYGGLAGLLDIFINILIKAIGNMAKQFFFFKNTIDLLVGFQLGELLGNAIPGIVKILQELKLLFSNPSKWMMITMLGPLFDSNIPIPKFCLDIGHFVPFLPFKLCIPEIDPYGYFSKNTALNLNNNEKVPLNWMETIIDEIDVLIKEDLEESKKKEKELREKIDIDIKTIQNRLNNINIYEIPLNNCKIKLKNIELKETSCHDFGCSQNIIDTLCDELEKEKKCLLDLETKYNLEKLKINKINKNVETKKLEILKDKKELLNKKEFKTNIDYKKRAILIAYLQNIENENLDIKLSRMHEIGVDVFDNTNLDLLQKLGHDFSNDKYLSKLENIRKLGISLNNNKLLRFLYNIGFNFNDKKHYTKLSNLKKYVSLDSTIIVLLFDMGLNINNPKIFDILKIIKESNLDLTDLTIISRLQQISFNFNNPNSIDRLIYLLKYIDLNDSTAFNNALKRNINLNNPYLNMILEKTYKISLRWGGTNENGYFDIENEIKNDTSIPDNIDAILKIFDKFKSINNIFFNQFYFKTEQDFASFKSNYPNTINDNEYIYITNYGPTYVTYEEELSTTFETIIEHFSGTTGTLSFEIYFNNILHDTQTSTTNFSFETIVPYGVKIDIKITTGNCNYIIKENNIEVDNGSATDEYFYTKISANTRTIVNFILKSATLSHFKSILNQYSKYDIILDIPDLKDIKPYENEYTIENSTSKRFIDGSNLYREKLELLKEFHINKGWKIDSNGDGVLDNNDITVNENIGGQNTDQNWNNVNNDFENILAGLTNSEGDSLTLVKEPTPDKTKITYAILLGIYGNFDKLGLNIKDPNFKEKFDLLYNRFDLNIDETVILDTTINTLNQNDVIQSTKPVVQFAVLQNLGFNFQQENYNEFINKFSSQLDLTKFETKYISETLISLGWHYSNDSNFNKINKFIDFGFSFNIIKDSLDNPTYPSQMFSKLEHLNQWGFSFFKTSYVNMINKLSELDIRLNNSNFETVIENLIGFGINLNDSDWQEKLQSLINLNMNFGLKTINIKTYFNNREEQIKIEQWKVELDNLHGFGIDFYGDDWKKKYNKALSIKSLGLDFKRTDLREKITILNDLGIDFSTNEDEWMKKIESLIKLKIISVPVSVIKDKTLYLENRKEKLDSIDAEIRKYTRLNEDPLFFINEKIRKVYNKLNIYKEKLKIDNDDEICNIILDLDDELKKYQLEKENLKIIRFNYSDKIKQLNENKKNIKNEVYKLNKKLIFGDLEKFVSLKNSGLEFYSDNYNKNIDVLIKKGFDFSKTNWKELLNELIPFIEINPILTWQMTMIEIIKTIIMMPLQLIMGIIKKLMGLIKQVIGIPLNPTKIPAWTKGIIEKFFELIDMIMKLPSLEGMTDFLFMNTEGLTLIDVFIPGFSIFMTTLKNKIKSWKSEENNLNNSINTKILNIQKLKIERNILVNKIHMLVSDNNQKIELQIKIFEDNNTKMKKMISNSDLSINTLKHIENELQKNCNAINNLKNLLEEDSKSFDGVDLNNDLIDLNNKIDDLNNDLLKDKNKQLELKNKNDIINGDICEWRKNIDLLIIKILRDLTDDIKNEKNPYEKKLINSKLNLKKYKETLKIAENKKATIIDNDKTSLIIKLKSEIDNIDNIACSGSLSRAALNDAALKKKDLENQLINLNSKIILSDINLLISSLKEKIDKLNIDIKNLETKNETFKDNQLKNIIDLEGVTKWIPTILNIVCCSPKMVANIFIVIMNSVGHMDYLPNLWNFDYLE